MPGTVRPAASPDPPAPTRKRILIVEDEAPISEMLSDHLALLGYESLAAFDGATAIDIAWREQPSLITLDLSLPDMNGYAVLRVLKTDEATAHIPLIILSAYASSNLPEDLPGAVALVRKPFDLDKLTETIRIS